MKNLMTIQAILAYVTAPVRATLEDTKVVNLMVLNKEVGILPALEARGVDMAPTLTTLLMENGKHAFDPSSSMVNHVEYDVEDNQLVVTYASGNPYLYDNVPVSVWVDLLLSDMYGTFSTYIRENVRGNSEYVVESEVV